MRIIREHIFDTLQSIYMLLHRRGQYIIWPAGAHNGVARHIYVPDAIFSNRFGPKQEHKVPYIIDICSLPSALQERTLQCTQISRNPNSDKYISIFGQKNLAFWIKIIGILTFFLFFWPNNFANWTNTFDNLDKYIWQFGEIHLRLRQIQFKGIHFSIGNFFLQFWQKSDDKDIE